MGNIFSNCFTDKQKASDRWIREEEEENKHHEQRNSTASADKISDLPDRWREEEENKDHERNSASSDERISDLPDPCSDEEEENKHHEQNSIASADGISDLPDRWSEEEENKLYEKGNSASSDERISDLPDPCSDEEEENKHHEQNSIASADGISDLPDRWSEEEENKRYEKGNSTDSAVDRISDLPDDILLLILSLLPLKSVGQTSVLSRRWIHVWCSYPIIDFYDIFTGNEAVHHQTRARIINTVLACHDETYNIIYPCLKISLPRDRLGQFLRVGWDPNDSYCLPRVEELVLDISLSSENTSDLPQCQLKCHSLRSSYSSCWSSKASWLGFPSSYVVRSYLLSLQALSLIRVDFLDSALGVELFSGSSFPFLEKLNLEWCRGMRDLKIFFPNLKDIFVVGMDLNSMDICGMRLEKLSVSYCFENCINGSWVNIFAPNLQNLYWGFNAITEKCSIQSFPAFRSSYMSYFFPFGITAKKIDHNSVVDLLSCSSEVEDLTIRYDYIQILSEIYFVSGGLPFSFLKLKTLTICPPLQNECTPGIACLFKSSPVVQTLDIWFLPSIKGNSILLDDANYCSTQEQYWETQAQYLTPFLSHLKVVKIGLGDMIPENAITFAKFVLKYGRGLQELILSFNRSKSSLPPNSLNDTIALIEGFPRESADVKFSTLCY